MRNLRVTSPAWLERRHPKERGNFVPASRVGTKEPGENGSPNESLAGGAEAARQRKQRQRLRSKARQPQEDGRSAEGLAAGVTDDLERKLHRRPGRDARSEGDWKDHRELSGKAKKNRCCMKIHRRVNWMVFDLASYEAPGRRRRPQGFRRFRFLPPSWVSRQCMAEAPGPWPGRFLLSMNASTIRPTDIHDSSM